MKPIAEAEKRLRLHEARKAALENLEIAIAAADSGQQRQRLERQRIKTQAMVHQVNLGLAVLDEEERMLLEGFYIKPVQGAVFWLCEELGCEVASVYRRRRKALERFATAEFG